MAETGFAVDFLRLTLEINRHIPGFVDAYIGPPALRVEVEREPAVPVEQLLETVQELETRVPSETVDPARHRYDRALLRAAQAALHLAHGENTDYLEEVRQLFDVSPALADESQFLAAQRELDILLPGEGDINRRMEARRKHYEVPRERLLVLLEAALNESRRRTSELYALVPGESVELRVTQDQPWGAYNWYHGNARSLIEFNTDVPVFALGIMSTMAHEGYPGHHTEGQLKEKRYLEERGYLELASLLLLSPAAVISEGIATTAIEIIFPDGEEHVWNREVLLPLAGIDTEETPEQMARIAQAQQALRYVSSNAALLYHTGELDESQAKEYVQTYALASPQRAAKSFEFFSNRLYRAYIFTYTRGYDLIAAAAREDKRALFQRLITQLVLPSDLVELTSNK